MRTFIAALTMLVAMADPADAHTRSQSVSHWQASGDTLAGRVEADALDATRLYALGGRQSLEETFARHVSDSIAITTRAGPCAPAASQFSPAAAGRVAVSLRFACPSGALAQAFELRSTLFIEVAPTHLHFASVAGAGGAEAEAVFTDSRRGATIDLSPQTTSPSAVAAFGQYIPIGAVHVGSGLDHIAFILALTLLARGFGPILIAASGFTLGHTATLGLAALGVLKPHAPTVEAMIGFTVAFVALEATTEGRRRLSRWAGTAALALVGLGMLGAIGLVGLSALALLGLAVFVVAYPRWRPEGASGAPWLAAAFGLIHGCGFAGALGEQDLPRQKLLSALAGFNVGVELAQAAVIAAAFAAVAVWRLLPVSRSTATQPVSAALFGLGTYWFASRALGA